MSHQASKQLPLMGTALQPSYPGQEFRTKFGHLWLSKERKKGLQENYQTHDPPNSPNKMYVRDAILHHYCKQERNSPKSAGSYHCITKILLKVRFHDTAQGTWKMSKKWLHWVQGNSREIREQNWKDDPCMSPNSLPKTNYAAIPCHKAGKRLKWRNTLTAWQSASCLLNRKWLLMLNGYSIQGPCICYFDFLHSGSKELCFFWSKSWDQ